MIAWMIVTAFFPLAMFLFSLLQIHKLLSQIRQYNLELINQQIQTAYNCLATTLSKDTAEQLSQLMDVQNKVGKMPEWPLALEGITTLAVTIVIPIVQIAISVFGVFSP